MRTATALYVRYAGGAEEYYDTATDPYELDNLSGKGVPAALRHALSALENCHAGPGGADTASGELSNMPGMRADPPVPASGMVDLSGSAEAGK